MTYFFGNGVPQDKTQAEKLTRGTYASVLEVAKKNDPDAQLCLALMYFEGLGVARDTEEALQWLRKSADQNYAPALVNLGAAFALGEGVARDDVEAAKWFRLAADQNNTVAQTYLGVFYNEGRGVERDVAEAARLWQLAAAQGSAQAQNNLGVLYDPPCRDGPGAPGRFKQLLRRTGRRLLLLIALVICHFLGKFLGGVLHLLLDV
jgi:TPR repeat protein